MHVNLERGPRERSSRWQIIWEVRGAVRQINETGDGVTEWITRSVQSTSLHPEEPHPPAASRLLPVLLTKKKSHPDLPHFLFSYALQAGASRDGYTDRTWMACSEAFEQKGAICINETPCLTEWPNPKCDVQGAMFTWKRSVQVVLMCLRCSAFLLATWIKSKRASLSRVQLTKSHEIALISQLTGTRFREI